MSLKKKHLIYIIISFTILAVGISAFYLITSARGKVDTENPIFLEKDIRRMEKHIEQNPADLDTMWELAERYSRVYREYDRAHELLSTILEVDPRHKMAMHLRAIILIEESKFSQALEQFEKMLSIDDSDPVTLHNISKIHFVSDREKALEYAKEAVKVESRLASQIQDHMYNPIFEEWEEAVLVFNANYEDNPIEACLKMGEHFLVEPTLMLEVCKFALESSRYSNSPDMYKLLEKIGLLYTEMGMYAEAIDTYKELIDIAPKYGRGYILLADRLAKLDRIQPLKPVYEKLQDQPGMEVEKNILDILLQYHSGEVDEAMERLGVMNIGEYNIFIYHIEAILYQKLGNEKEAIDSYNKVLNYDKGNYDFWQAVNYEINESLLSLAR